MVFLDSDFKKKKASPRMCFEKKYVLECDFGEIKSHKRWGRLLTTTETQVL